MSTVSSRSSGPSFMSLATQRPTDTTRDSDAADAALHPLTADAERADGPSLERQPGEEKPSLTVVPPALLSTILSRLSVLETDCNHLKAENQALRQQLDGYVNAPAAAPRATPVGTFATASPRSSSFRPLAVGGDAAGPTAIPSTTPTVESASNSNCCCADAGSSLSQTWQRPSPPPASPVPHSGGGGCRRGISFRGFLTHVPSFGPSSSSSCSVRAQSSGHGSGPGSSGLAPPQDARMDVDWAALVDEDKASSVATSAFVSRAATPPENSLQDSVCSSLSSDEGVSNRFRKAADNDGRSCEAADTTSRSDGRQRSAAGAAAHIAGSRRGSFRHAAKASASSCGITNTTSLSCSSAVAGAAAEASPARAGLSPETFCEGMSIGSVSLTLTQELAKVMLDLHKLSSTVDELHKKQSAETQKRRRLGHATWIEFRKISATLSHLRKNIRAITASGVGAPASTVDNPQWTARPRRDDSGSPANGPSQSHVKRSHSHRHHRSSGSAAAHDNEREVSPSSSRRCDDAAAGGTRRVCPESSVVGLSDAPLVSILLTPRASPTAEDETANLSHEEPQPLPTQHLAEEEETQPLPSLSVSITRAPISCRTPSSPCTTTSNAEVDSTGPVSEGNEDAQHESASAPQRMDGFKKGNSQALPQVALVGSTRVAAAGATRGHRSLSTSTSSKQRISPVPVAGLVSASSSTRKVSCGEAATTGEGGRDAASLPPLPIAATASGLDANTQSTTQQPDALPPRDRGGDPAMARGSLDNEANAAASLAGATEEPPHHTRPATPRAHSSKQLLLSSNEPPGREGSLLSARQRPSPGLHRQNPASPQPQSRPPAPPAIVRSVSSAASSLHPHARSGGGSAHGAIRRRKLKASRPSPSVTASSNRSSPTTTPALLPEATATDDIGTSSTSHNVCARAASRTRSGSRTRTPRVSPSAAHSTTRAAKRHTNSPASATSTAVPQPPSGNSPRRSSLLQHSSDVKDLPHPLPAPTSLSHKSARKSSSASMAASSVSPAPSASLSVPFSQEAASTPHVKRRGSLVGADGGLASGDAERGHHSHPTSVSRQDLASQAKSTSNCSVNDSSRSSKDTTSLTRRVLAAAPPPLSVESLTASGSSPPSTAVSTHVPQLAAAVKDGNARQPEQRPAQASSHQTPQQHHAQAAETEAGKQQQQQQQRGNVGSSKESRSFRDTKGAGSHQHSHRKAEIAPATPITTTETAAAAIVVSHSEEGTSRASPDRSAHDTMPPPSNSGAVEVMQNPGGGGSSAASASDEDEDVMGGTPTPDGCFFLSAPAVGAEGITAGLSCDVAGVHSGAAAAVDNAAAAARSFLYDAAVTPVSAVVRRRRAVHHAGQNRVATSALPVALGCEDGLQGPAQGAGKGGTGPEACDLGGKPSDRIRPVTCLGAPLADSLAAQLHSGMTQGDGSKSAEVAISDGLPERVPSALVRPSTCTAASDTTRRALLAAQRGSRRRDRGGLVAATRAVVRERTSTAAEKSRHRASAVSATTSGAAVNDDGPLSRSQSTTEPMLLFEQFDTHNADCPRDGNTGLVGGEEAGNKPFLEANTTGSAPHSMVPPPPSSSSSEASLLVRRPPPMLQTLAGRGPGSDEAEAASRRKVSFVYPSPHTADRERKRAEDEQAVLVVEEAILGRMLRLSK